LVQTVKQKAEAAAAAAAKGSKAQQAGSKRKRDVGAAGPTAEEFREAVVRRVKDKWHKGKKEKLPAIYSWDSQHHQEVDAGGDSPALHQDAAGHH
jgi:hypothetical protein